MQKNRSRNSRGRANGAPLSSIGLAVLATLVAGGAQAADTTVATIPTVAVNTTAYQSVQSVQDKSQPVTATAAGTVIDVTTTGGQTGGSNTVTKNSVKAAGTANSFTNAIDLSLAGGTGPVPAEGAASLGVQTNSGVISSVATGNTVKVELEGFASGGAANTANTVSATTTINSGSSTISGTVPVDYASTSPASVVLSYGPAGSSSSVHGSLVSTSVQQGAGAASSATATGNAVSLTLTADGDNSVAAAPVLDGNTVSATLKGNTANSTISVQSGGAPAFTGSAVVSNQQLNQSLVPVTHTASANGNSVIASIGGNAAGDTNTLNGSLSVQGNTISSTVTGNEALGTTAGTAGNRIVLADGVSVTGTGAVPSNFASYGSGNLASSLAADLAVSNSQGNVGVSLSAATQGSGVLASVQSLDGGAVTVGNNATTASATGNAASNAILSGKDAAAFTATAALANQQSNYNGGVSAISGPTFIGAMTGSENGTNNAASVSVTGNRSASTAYGNNASQSLALAANTLPLSGANTVLTGGSLPDGNVAASGAATVTNLQSNYSAPVSAQTVGSVIGLMGDSRGTGGDTIRGSSFTVGNNTQEAVGLSNSAGNALSLTGTSVGSGAGVASVQVTDAASPVSAVLEGSSAAAYLGTHATDSTVALTNNLQRAVAYANSAANSLSVAANSATVAASGAPASVATPLAGSAEVTASYGLLSNQTAAGAVSATADGASVLPIGAQTVLIEGNVTRGSVSNQGNAFVAAAYGNDATNAGKLALGTGTTVPSAAPVGNVTSVQNASSTITATASGANVVATAIEDDVSASTVATSGNQLQALAYGNRASGNTLDVSGNTLATITAQPRAVSSGGTATTDAAFSVQSVQNAAGSLTASLRSGAAPGATASQILTQIGGDVTGSSVASNGNSASAAATANSATNGLTLAGNSLSTSSAVQNVQNSSASVEALAGQAGTPGMPASPAAPFTYNATVLDPAVFGGATVGANTTITSGTLGVLISSLTPAQQSYLTSHGWSQGSGANANMLTAPASIVGVVPTTTFQQMLALSPVAFNATIPGTSAVAAIPNQGGVTVAVSGNVAGSQLAVNGNSSSAAVTGNSATNSASVSGNAIVSGGAGTASAGLLAGATGAQADHTVSNLQQVTGGAALSTSVFGTYAIDVTGGAAISGSTLSVSDNSQRGSSVANTATNSLSVAGTNVSSTSALSSAQSGNAAVSAASDLELYAPAAASASSVDLSRNKNVALGVINDVTNSLSVKASNVSPAGPAINAQLTAGTAVGDNVLNNVQTATTSVSSTAATRLYNQDQTATATTGLANSTATISANTTTAEASANRADNSVALNGAAVLGANAGLNNTQSSSAAVTANASTSATFRLEGTSPATPAALNSGITIDGNSTTALARGNAASNVLNVSAGSGYAAASTTAGSSVGGTTQATAALLNTQGNSGNVSASASGTYQVALNGVTAGTAPGITNGTAALTGNTVAAQAYGNTATNAVTVAATAANRPTVAVGNYQTNSGAITATATAVNYGVGVTGAAAGSTLRAAGNQVTATAVGNSAVSTIASAR
ncbi:S-layer family protein [uncultured Variovorax sp.]|uniref:beta strand repeat-containing protein n=1 Tax=uncultured Variovorax sp. TaxID=114708 RepID=UPI0025E110F4|nr:S-layer family protein [uncultured Variovorax sp.]